jgi:LysM repeat protein
LVYHDDVVVMLLKVNSAVVLLLILMAIILAIGVFLAFSYLMRRPELPEGMRTQIVEGVVVTLQDDPASAVQMVGPALDQSPPVTLPEQPVDQPPAQQEPVAQIEPTPLPTIPPPAPTPVPDSIIFIDYVVQQGDTLYGIARRMDTSIALMARYNISQENLVPGTVLRLPIGNPAYCPGRRPYAVGEGDTIFTLGRRFNVTPTDLKAINNLGDEYIIYVATIICIP